jgi:CHAT domain-containing protein
MQTELEKTFGPITTLKGQNFILPNLSRALHTPYTITHVFSHAQFFPQVSNTFIVTYNDKLSMNQLEQLIAPKQYSDVPLELLTLSACETAKGNERAALGLAGIAYKAGARSAVATLWSVREDVVYHLFKRFYQEFGEKQQPKAQAMQQAQLMLLRKYPSWQHPHYWAAFLLIGHWL